MTDLFTQLRWQDVVDITLICRCRVLDQSADPWHPCGTDADGLGDSVRHLSPVASL